MNKLLIAVALLLSFSVALPAQEKKTAGKSSSNAAVLEATVNRLWEAFQKKDKATLSSLLDDGFRMFEEGTSSFGDKKTEVNAVDEFEGEEKSGIFKRDKPPRILVAFAGKSLY